MVIAGEASGDLLASELTRALRARAPGGMQPVFFGAGGPHMAKVGVDLAFDLTAHAVVGIWEVVRQYWKFRRFFHQLLAMAEERRPDVIIGVDYSGFNRRFAQAAKRRAQAMVGSDWNPHLVQFVSPQVWASRSGRAQAMARDYAMVLSIFPFEKDWYASHAPGLRVEFVGHPIFDRYPPKVVTGQSAAAEPYVVFLPGSRVAELKRHLPPLLGAWAILRTTLPGLRARMVLPNNELMALTRSFNPPPEIVLQVGGLADALRGATIALASTGTVTVECAYFGVPTVALYKTSWLTFEIARRLVKVQHLAMPNLLANERLFPEFIQTEATAENLARAALALLQDDLQRAQIKRRLGKVMATLGQPGAADRAAQRVWELLDSPTPHAGEIIAG